MEVSISEPPVGKMRRKTGVRIRLKGITLGHLYCCIYLLSAFVAITGDASMDTLNLKIYPSRKLRNGTLHVTRGDRVEFNCTNLLGLMEMSWLFPNSGLNTTTESTSNGTFIYFSLSKIMPESQGNYTCFARNLTDDTVQQSTVEVLVYYSPSILPQCQANSSDSLALVLFCSWTGGYPDPTLYWRDDETDLEMAQPLIEANKTDKVFEVAVNATQLPIGKKFKCVGVHPSSRQKKEQSCIVNLSAPLPITTPMMTCFLNSNITLFCKETNAYPDSRITWLKSKNETEITPSSKYIISQTSGESNLTITNCSQETDADIYFCKSTNIVGIKEAEILLSVTSPRNIAGLAGAIVLLILLGALAIVGIVLYCNRHTFFKGNMFRNQANHDVLNLVDSEWEDEDSAVSSIAEVTSVANGHTAPFTSTVPVMNGYTEMSNPDTTEMPKEDSSHHEDSH